MIKSITNQPLTKERKISINLDEKVLKVIDCLAKLTKSNRTMVVTAIANKGISPIIEEMKKVWTGLLVKGNLEGAQKKNIEILLKDLEEIKKNWKKINE